MYTTQIHLATINDVKRFVNTVNLYDFDVDLSAGRYKIDAKSIMGIFSLDLSKPMDIEIHTEEPQEFLEKIKDFLVK